MARINCVCEDCKNKFNLLYFFIKPNSIKCPACGSQSVKEETGRSQGCGCGGSEDKPFKFT